MLISTPSSPLTSHQIKKLLALCCLHTVTGDQNQIEKKKRISSLNIHQVGKYRACFWWQHCHLKKIKYSNIMSRKIQNLFSSPLFYSLLQSDIQSMFKYSPPWGFNGMLHWISNKTSLADWHLLAPCRQLWYDQVTGIKWWNIQSIDWNLVTKIYVARNHQW